MVSAFINTVQRKKQTQRDNPNIIHYRDIEKRIQILLEIEAKLTFEEGIKINR